jgi:frataxin-like iron-binding protein CyaY
MYKMGTLFGADILLNSNDPKIQKLADNYWESVNKKLERLGEMEIDAEMAKFTADFKP